MENASGGGREKKKRRYEVDLAGGGVKGGVNSLARHPFLPREGHPTPTRPLRNKGKEVKAAPNLHLRIIDEAMEVQ